ncbi:MAG: M23 family metallopeptidase [Candidatus Neomarinimicrobiota bacterium]|jgi:murein DD-endopeptidase MepM/ murein hydrolase activator NlpD|nr:M23 family metallopeptidase [Candidatus Neomarinimicrobiota bacterium]
MSFIRKRRKIIILNEDSAEMKEVQLTTRKTLALSSIALLLLFTPILSFLWFFYTNPSLKEVRDIREDNQKLVKKIEENQKNLNILYENLEKIQGHDERLRKMINLPSISKDIRKMGTGGSIQKENSSSLNYLIPIDDFDLNIYTKKIEHARRWANLEQLSYIEIIEKAKKNPKLYKAIPAIIPLDKSISEFTSGYGMRRDPFSGKKKRHDGHDFSAKIGTPIFATADGVVIKSLYWGSYGNYIEIDHGYGYKTVYAHLKKRKVKKRQTVSRGDIIGTLGNTGKSTAPHLHYEIKKNNKRINPKDYYFTEKHF